MNLSGLNAGFFKSKIMFWLPKMYLNKKMDNYKIYLFFICYHCFKIHLAMVLILNKKTDLEDTFLNLQNNKRTNK